MINLIKDDPNEYYLNKYLDGLDRDANLAEEFDAEIQDDLEQILEHCEAIEKIANEYENKYGLCFKVKDIVIQFIKENF
jgi:hypothetical protein